jgi:hypothetical protein
LPNLLFDNKTLRYFFSALIRMSSCDIMRIINKGSEVQILGVDIFGIVEDILSVLPEVVAEARVILGSR